MNETEFIDKWNIDKPTYQAWGDYIVSIIYQELEKAGKNLNEFLKIPAKCRLKDDASLVDKAFYRPNKNYSDPYNDIEDKVGARLVVLLLADIKEICNIIERNEVWSFDACKHFDEDKEKEPLLFTYQSVHYILRPKKEINLGDLNISTSISCELQIRTLLQHAHSELTHDAIYKSKKTVKPKVHRTVAKSMALIETTDDFFTSVTKDLNYGPLEEHGILKRLDGLYLSFTGMEPHTLKSSIVIWDEFEQFIDEKLFDYIQNLFNKPEYGYLASTIKEKYSNNNFYQQSTVLFLYWMLINKKQRLLKDWPFKRELIEPFAVDLGVSTWDE